MNGPERFAETTLPPPEAFYSQLTKENISPEDYEHAQNMWNSFNMNNLKEYHDLYLKLDVLLLAEVFETFRDLCLMDYKLDPVHMYSLPGLTWQTALKTTNIKLELFRYKFAFVY